MTVPMTLLFACALAWALARLERRSARSAPAIRPAAIAWEPARPRASRPVLVLAAREVRAAPSPGRSSAPRPPSFMR